jgi:hypothetical protein
MTSEIKVDTISEQTSANGVTIDGLTIKDGNIIGDVALAGTTPTFTVGDGGAEDASLIFDGNAQDFYVALDDSADDLVIGLGSTVGTTPIMSFDESKNVTIHDGTLTVESDNANALMAPLLKLDRISSSPADGDLIGAIRYTARLDGGSSAEFAGLEAKIIESSTADGEITLNIAKGGNVRSALKANNTEVIINDASEDLDFRVESNGNANMLFVDGGENRVGFGTGTPGRDYQFLTTDQTDVSIIAANNQYAQLLFGDPDDDNIGSIGYNNTSDAMEFTANTQQIFTIHSSGVVFNEASNDQNFRIESNDFSHMFFVDAGLNEVMVGGNGQQDAHFSVQNGTTSETAQVNTCTNSSYTGIVLDMGVSRNTTDGTYTFLKCQRRGFANSVIITDGGTMTTTNNSYGAISDERLKSNITDANSQWNDIKALKVKNYKMLQDPDQNTHIGVISQDLETAGMNGLINETEADEYQIAYVDDESVLKAGDKVKEVKYSVLYMKAIKALQEAQTRIETLETKVAALEG